MRTLLVAFALIVGSAGLAVAQPKTALRDYKAEPTVEKEDSTKDGAAARRRGTGQPDISAFGVKKQEPVEQFPWMGVGVVLIVILMTSPLIVKVVRGARKDLEDQSTFGLQRNREEREKESGGEPRPARRPMKKAEAKAADAPAEDESAGSARDAVWGVLSSAAGWLSADKISAQAKVPTSDAEAELATLVEEGYIQEAKERAGKSVFKVAS